MNLDELQKHWNQFGKDDPMWAILAIPEMKNNNWDPAEFFQRGVSEIAENISKVEAMGTKISYGRALDFGCGVGRLTQALAARFEEVHGVDIAPSMIEAARRFNQFGEKCTYHLNKRNDLSLFPDNHFDFIYSVIVLQHMRPKYSLPYIREFLRVLRPGGVLAFQLPSELKPEFAQKREQARRSTPLKTRLLRPFRTMLHRVRSRINPTPEKDFKPRMEMHGVPKDKLLAFLVKNKAIVLDVQDDSWSGPPWYSFKYFVTKH